MKIHEGDTVKVIAGRDNGVVGKVLSLDKKRNRLVVEGANKVFKHVRPSQRNPQGCLLYTSPSPRDQRGSRMPSSA